jgi:subtilisin-like proprotein convertase family protein
MTLRGSRDSSSRADCGQSPFMQMHTPKSQSTKTNNDDPVKIRSASLFLRMLLILLSSGFLAAAAELHEFTPNAAIPDGSFSGLSDTRVITSSVDVMSGLRVRLNIAGEFNGDLYAYLRHVVGTRTNFIILLNRPGRTAANSFGYGDAGLNVTFDAAGAGGDIHLYQGVTVPAAGSPLTGVFEPDGRRVDPLNVTDASPRQTSLDTFNGASASGTWTLFVADVDSGASHTLVSWGLEIEGRAVPVITWATPADIVYGTPLGAQQLNASTTVPGAFVYTPASGTVLDAGAAQTLSVTFTPEDLDAYLPATANVNINVLKRTLLVTASDAVKIYGAPMPSLTFQFGEFVNGDDASDLETAPSISTTATSASSAGEYDITVSGGSSANYELSYVAGTLTINPAATSAALTSSANPALPGTTITFTLAVSIVPAGAGIVDGMVQFKVDGANAGDPVTVADGIATYATVLPLGSHSIAADYLGSGNLTGSSATLSQPQLINTPPVAAADSVDRWPSNGVKVALSKLLANDSDADGDPVVLTAVAAASANGGSVTVQGSWVIYTPATGFTGPDSFTYTISDGRGAPVTGTVTVALKPLGGRSNLEIANLGSGQFRVSVNGVPGFTYRVEYAESLDAETWEEVGSGAANEAGYLEFTHDRGVLPQCFYRALSP